MKTLLALAGVGIVILLAWMLKRKFKQAQAIKPQASANKIQQKTLPELQSEANEITTPEPVSFNDETREYVEVESKQEEQQPETKAMPQVFRMETIPEDSTLRRHYFSNLEAERLAITHPYPTDSMLRRHYESGLAWQLKPDFLGSSGLAAIVEEAESNVSRDQAEIKWKIPEDSTLRRHFLTQIQTEVETNLFPRPTDATLRRHYDSLVKSRVEAYLTAIAA